MGVYKRGEVYYVRFQVGGHKVNQSADTDSKLEARALEKRLKEKLRAKARGITIDRPVDDAIGDFILVGDGRPDQKTPPPPNYQPGHNLGMKPSAWERYKVSYRQLAPYTAGKMISDIDRRWVAQYVTERQKQGVTNRTVRRDLDALSAVMNRLVNEGEIEHNRVRDYDIGQGLPEFQVEIRVPTIREIQTLIDMSHQMLASLIAFQALTGLRQSEATLAEWNEFDPDKGTLVVPKSKTTSPRTVHLFGSALEILRSLPKPPDHKRSPRGGHIFWHGNGSPFIGFANTFWNLKTLLGLELRDHDLRHFYAWLYLRRGGRIEALKGQLGHTNISTTEQYAHLADDLAHWDLVVMGERVATKSSQTFDVRFSFENCGGFLDSREAQARSRRLFAEFREKKAEKKPVAKSLQVKRSSARSRESAGQIP